MIAGNELIGALAAIVATAITFLEVPLRVAQESSLWTATWRKPGPWTAANRSGE
jgi:hypothetical protein